MFTPTIPGLTDVRQAMENARAVGQQLTYRRVEMVEDWHVLGDPGEPTLQNGWFPFAGSIDPGYLKDNNGDVHLAGWLLNNNAPGGQHTVLTLPDGYRPEQAVLQSAYQLFNFSPTNYASGWIIINVDGTIQTNAQGLIDGTFSRFGLVLGGHRFPAA
jgi:hypothetical protein